MYIYIYIYKYSYIYIHIYIYIYVYMYIYIARTAGEHTHIQVAHGLGRLGVSLVRTSTGLGHFQAVRKVKTMPMTAV